MLVFHIEGKNESFIELFFISCAFKKISLNCRHYLINTGVEWFKILFDCIKLALFEDGTKIDDDTYLLALGQGTNLLVYQSIDSKHYNVYFVVKQFLSISY